MNCITTGGQYTPPVSIPYDANAGARTAVFKGCMYGDGWSLERHEANTGTPVSADPAAPQTDWGKGYSWGYLLGLHAGCDDPPSSVTIATEWIAGCTAGSGKR